MIAVVYKFKVKEYRAEIFIEAWTNLTKYIREYAGSKGSRLHKLEEDVFWAYAQWPDADTFDKAEARLPIQALELRQKMLDVCEDVERLYEGEVIVDRLE